MFFRNRMKRRKSESGEVMLESTIIMVLTMLLLIWILAIGFVYYQKYVTTIITNDTATKIASTYSNPTSDIIMGFVKAEDLSARNLYRNFTADNLVEVHKERAEQYINYQLTKSNFLGTIDNIEVLVELKRDSLTRKHVQITTNVTFNTPFGVALEVFGFESKQTYSMISCAECTDIADYCSTIAYGEYLGREVRENDFIDSVVSLINSLLSLYNRVKN